MLYIRDRGSGEPQERQERVPAFPTYIFWIFCLDFIFILCVLVRVLVRVGDWWEQV